MNNPHFIIIGGPNGAGKSTLANDLVSKYGISSFDFDKEYYARWAEFGYDPAVQRGCKEYTSDLFQKKVLEAFASKKNFCFESNYHTQDVLSYIEPATKLGYEKTLVFIGLKNDTLAKSRVAHRVKNKGHFVAVNEIEERFKGGLRLLDESYGKFDRVFLSESLPNYRIKTCIGITREDIVIRSKPSYLRHLPRLKKELNRGKLIDSSINI